MSVTARVNNRLTQLAVGRHLPHRTVRVRLTLLYGALFLLSGAALMAITYALLVNAGFVFTLQNGTSTELIPERPSSLAGRGPPFGATNSASNASAAGPALAFARCMRSSGVPDFPDPNPGGGGFRIPAGANPAAPPFRAAKAKCQHFMALPGGLGSPTHPSAQTLAQWRGVAQCMRRHGVSGFPNPTTSVRSDLVGIGVVADREGAIFALSATVMQSPALTQASAACGFTIAAPSNLTAEDNRRRTQTRQQLLIQSGIALAGMSLLSLVLGWLMAGRFLTPLEDSYQAQRQFVANASHELRAPLTRQRALIQVALADPDASFTSLRAAHERVLVSEQHLEQMIDGLLTLTRGQAGLERRESLDLAAIASQAVLARASEAAGRDLDLRAALAAAPVEGDPRLVERLLANLIDNAIRHNTPGGHLEITTGIRDRHAYLAITNTGPAVPPEEIRRLLQPFQRLHGTRTQHNNGHGLGLSIVQAIAAAHRAELITHARPQGGLTIEVSFPPASSAGSRVTSRAALSADWQVSQSAPPARR
jgi:signal transduction histidine kinase